MLTGLSILAACNPEYITKRELSDLMQENGRVIDTLYSQEHRKSDLDIGMTSGGDLAFTPRSIRIPETWGVVFRCDRGNKFAIQGSEPKYKTLWEKMDPGMEVIIDYKEIRDNKYKDTNGDGVRDLVSSIVIDYDFIDANPKKK